MLEKIFFNEKAQKYLRQISKQYTTIFVLVDENTHVHCWPILQQAIGDASEHWELLEIPAGEEQKNLAVCESLWWALAENGADRHSLLINLGGGVLCDMGAFVARCFMRGIDYVNVPSTLLAMVDAAVGGKNGIDLGPLKNLVGTIDENSKCLIFTEFLDSLEPDELLSGWAECLKHALIADTELWQDLSKIDKLYPEAIKEYLPALVQIKVDIVTVDPYEQKDRKALNYGHTIGHAIESCFLEQGQAIKHGFAVVLGILLENKLALSLGLLKAQEQEAIATVLLKQFPDLPDYQSLDLNAVIDKLRYDKKNKDGQLYFSLINSPGQAQINVEMSFEQLALFLRKIWR